MKKAILGLSLILILLFPLTTAFAAAPQQLPASALPVGTCPPGFVLHDFMDHTDHDMHIGITFDLNGNGFICVKHLDNGLHVHMDDVVQQSSTSGFNLLQMIFSLFGLPW